MEWDSDKNLTMIKTFTFNYAILFLLIQRFYV